MRAAILLGVVVFPIAVQAETINADRLVLADGEVVEMCDGLIQPVEGDSLPSVTADSGSVFILSGGRVQGASEGVAVAAADSRVVISGGVIGSGELGIVADNSSIVINGGEIGGGRLLSIVANSSSVEMTGGTIRAGNRGSMRLSNGSSFLMSGGTMSSPGETHIDARSGSDVTLRGNAFVSATFGGSVVGSGGGTLTISEDAVIEGGEAPVQWFGDIRISDRAIVRGAPYHGTIFGGSGDMLISGGRLEGGPIVSYRNGTMATISGGEFILTSSDEVPALSIIDTPLDISGGFFGGDIHVNGTDEVNIWGGSLTFEDGRLTGMLADLTPIDVNLIAQNVILHNIIDPLPGDTNSDGRVSLADLNNVRNHFGDMGADDGTLAGDSYPYDGQVNSDDLNAVRNNFGVTSQAAAVPEPSTITFATLGVCFCLAAWRNSRC